MCGSIVDIQFATAEIRRGKKKRIEDTTGHTYVRTVHKKYFPWPNLSGRKLDVYYTSTHGLVGVAILGAVVSAVVDIS